MLCALCRAGMNDSMMSLLRSNHHKIFPAGGIAVRTYRYYAPATRGLDLRGMLEDLASARQGSIVLLHACAHNPTGVDPTLDQWKVRQGGGVGACAEPEGPLAAPLDALCSARLDTAFQCIG